MRKRVSVTSRFVLAVICFVFLAASLARAQEQEPLLSPPARAECAFPDKKTVRISYSSPRIRGRKIYGGLVPYGEEWRVGANDATTFVLSTNVLVGDTPVPAGRYTIFALPNAADWKLIVSKKTGEWGIPYPGSQFDLARIPMKLGTLPKQLENFTISFDKTGGKCTMQWDWVNTRVYIDITESK